MTAADRCLGIVALEHLMQLPRERRGVGQEACMTARECNRLGIKALGQGEPGVVGSSLAESSPTAF